jgi:hypothetical protein
MDFFQAQDFFKQMHPDKVITYEFDDNCHRTLEIVHTDGKPNLIAHVECNKVRVNVEGQPHVYVPIQPHRMNTTWAAAKKYLNDKTDVFIHPEEIEALNKLADEDKESYDAKLAQLCEYSGLKPEEIECKCRS